MIYTLNEQLSFHTGSSLIRLNTVRSRFAIPPDLSQANSSPPFHSKRVRFTPVPDEAPFASSFPGSRYLIWQDDSGGSFQHAEREEKEKKRKGKERKSKNWPTFSFFLPPCLFCLQLALYPFSTQPLPPSLSPSPPPSLDCSFP